MDKLKRGKETDFDYEYRLRGSIDTEINLFESRSFCCIT